MTLWLNFPEAPVIVMVNVPTLAVLEALTVSVLLVVAGLGRNEVVTPFGEPDTDSVTLLLKLLSRLMVMVLVPLPPRATVLIPLRVVRQPLPYRITEGLSVIR